VEGEEEGRGWDEFEGERKGGGVKAGGMQVLRRRWSLMFDRMFSHVWGCGLEVKKGGLGGMGEPWVIECRQVRVRGLSSDVCVVSMGMRPVNLLKQKRSSDEEKL